MLGGWASGSPYPLLGSLRSAAQVISYELALGLSIIAVVLYAGSLSTADIVAAQSTGWYIWLLPVSFAIFAVSMVGETNRAPFDLPEAESELVGGFHTEYSSLKFALFFLAEYVNMVTLSAVATTLFLGGWQAPWPLSLWPAANEGWLPIVWFLVKIAGVPVRLRLAARHAAPPALRPVHGAGLEGADPDQPGVDPDARRHAARAAGRADHRPGALIVGGVALVLLVGAALLLPDQTPPDDDPEPPVVADYPVPPLDLAVPPTPKRRRRAVTAARGDDREAETVTAGAKEGDR